jgi:hypothetical protein
MTAIIVPLEHTFCACLPDPVLLMQSSLLDLTAKPLFGTERKFRCADVWIRSFFQFSALPTGGSIR